MDYKKHYELLIETRKNRQIISNFYYEKHHILPKSMGGDDNKENLIYLTAREHFIAHWLLWRIYQNKEMAFAFFSMVYMNKNHKINSSRIYEECKLARRNFIIEMNKKIHKGKKLSKNQIESISLRFKNKPKTSEHRKKISESLKNKHKTINHKKNISKSLKNYDWTNHLERNKKISISNSGEKNGRSKKVLMYNTNHVLLLTFNTMKDALNHINITNNISKTTFYRYILKQKQIENVYFVFN